MRPLLNRFAALLRPAGRADGRALPPVLVEHRSSGADAAIVFLHGFSGDAALTWGSFADQLLEETTLRSWDVLSIGYPTGLRVDVPDLWSADPGIPLLALGLRTALSVRPLDGYRSIALVAHSMGGLVAQRALVDDATLASRTSHLALFGTPSAGLGKAFPVTLAKRQLRDMAAGSRFIRTLRRDWDARFGSRPPFRLLVVAGDRDEFVPASSSLEPFADESRAVVPGNHLQIVKPEDRDHRSVGLLVGALAASPALRGAVDGARVAVELGDFRAAVDVLLPLAAEIDSAALDSLALALEGLGRGAEALELLRHHRGAGIDETDAMGVLAGRLKRRWLVQRRAADLTEARNLYRRGLERAQEADNDAQAYYHAINLAFLALAAGNGVGATAEAENMARLALTHCERAPGTHWNLATQGEAQLVLGNLDQAEARYAEAFSLVRSPREVDSMYAQAVQVASRVAGTAGASRIEALFGLGPDRNGESADG